MSIRVRPLRYWQVHKGDRPCASYGRQSYLTDDRRFQIKYRNGSWIVQGHMMERVLCQRLTPTGLLHTSFPRRCDAVEALEKTLEAEGFRGVSA